MGNNQSQAKEEEIGDLVQKTKFDIIVKCLECLDYVEITDAVIDTNIEDLSEDISQILNEFRESKLIEEASGDVYNAVVSEVEKFANENKFSIRILFQTLEESCVEFQDIANTITSVDFVADEENSLEFTDDDALLTIHSSCTHILAHYYSELQKVKMPVSVATARLSSLRRMLFKQANEIVSDAVSDLVADFKNRTIDELDNLFCLGMTKNFFAIENVTKARKILKQLIFLSKEARDALTAASFSDRSLLQNASSEIAEYVENIIRRVQLQYASVNLEAAEALMDLDVDDIDESEIESLTTDADVLLLLENSSETGRSRASTVSGTPSTVKSAAATPNTIKSVKSATKGTPKSVVKSVVKSVQMVTVDSPAPSSTTKETAVSTTKKTTKDTVTPAVKGKRSSAADFSGGPFTVGKKTSSKKVKASWSTTPKISNVMNRDVNSDESGDEGSDEKSTVKSVVKSEVDSENAPDSEVSSPFGSATASATIATTSVTAPNSSLKSPLSVKSPRSPLPQVHFELLGGTRSWSKEPQSPKATTPTTAPVTATKATARNTPATANKSGVKSATRSTAGRKSATKDTAEDESTPAAGSTVKKTRASARKSVAKKDKKVAALPIPQFVVDDDAGSSSDEEEVKVQSVKKSARKTPSRKAEEVSAEVAPVAEVSVKKATVGRKRKNVDEIAPASPEPRKAGRPSKKSKLAAAEEALAASATKSSTKVKHSDKKVMRKITRVTRKPKTGSVARILAVEEGAPEDEQE